MTEIGFEPWHLADGAWFAIGLLMLAAFCAWMAWDGLAAGDRHSGTVAGIMGAGYAAAGLFVAAL